MKNRLIIILRPIIIYSVIVEIILMIACAIIKIQHLHFPLNSGLIISAMIGQIIVGILIFCWLLITLFFTKQT